jgi:predicted dehydrogenase
MEKKIFTVAIIGVGGRGADTYGYLINEEPEHFDIVALCDLREEWLNRAAARFHVAKENTFLSEEEFFKEKRADILVVATPDVCHVRHATKAFELGYDLLLEKPITDNREECAALLDAQKKSGRQALVCHVLRYAPAFLKTKELIDEGKIGRLVAIDALERVAYWHQAHSYVRGNWRTTEQPCGSAPMILAKSCHDLDLLQYYAGSKCTSISSVGDLAFFKEENAPAGAAMRCVDCAAEKDCPYSAKKIYLDRWEEKGCPIDCWPYNILTGSPLSREKIEKAVAEGPYGRCVFHCDNNVVDHQQTLMTFENGVKATLTMTAFTHGSGRRLTFYGTMGQIVFDEGEGSIFVGEYGKEPTVISISEISESGYSHGGGDHGLVQQLYAMLTGHVTQATSLAASVESHLMGICAEESRLKGGELVYIHK